jgi:hypothetical protein
MFEWDIEMRTQPDLYEIRIRKHESWPWPPGKSADSVNCLNFKIERASGEDLDSQMHAEETTVAVT